MAEYAEVISQAMDMPLEKRAELAHRLIISLEQERTEPAGTLEDVLVARQQRVRQGNYVALDAKETLDRMKKSLGDRSTHEAASA